MTTSPREDLDALLDQAIRFAQHQRTTRGEFLPFEMSIATGGQQEMGMAGEDDTAEPEMVELLVTLLRERAARGEIRAAAICYDGRVTTDDGTTDAICVVLEHAAHEPVTAYLPYRDSTYGELFATGAEPRIF